MADPEPDEPSAGISPWAVPPWLERSANWAWRIILVALATFALVWVLDRLKLVVVSILVALLLATLAAPVVSWLVARRIPRLLSTWITVLVALAAIGGVGWLTTATVGEQLSDGDRWDEVEVEIREWLREGPLDMSEEEIEDLEDRLRDAVRGGVGGVSSERVRLILEVVGASFLSAILFFFFVKDGPKLWGWTLRHVHHPRREAVDVAGRAAFRALTGYMRGVAFTGVIDAVAIGFALWIIGVPLVIPLAVLTFLGAFFPIVGATVAGAIATLVALVTNGPGDAVLIALVTLAVQQLEGDLIMPLVMQRQVHLHPVVVLVALASGGALAGLIGAFVAVPIAAMITGASGALRGADVLTDLPETDLPEAPPP